MADHKKVRVDIHELRKSYYNNAEPYIFEENMNKDPVVQFDHWFKNLATYSLNYAEINAFALSTVSKGRPSSRMVLLKEYSNDGFVFYTNSVSRKVKEFTENPNAAMLFYWPIVDRQVRVEGHMEQLDTKQADEYWITRPLSSRIGSKLSLQSSVIPSRQYLEERRLQLEELAQEKGEAAITRPETWLGYILKPEYFEFWQGQSNRIHDRLIYERDENDSGNWIIRRLAP